MAGSNGNKLNPMGAIRRRVGRGYVKPYRLNDCKGVGLIGANQSGLRYSLFPG